MDACNTNQKLKIGDTVECHDVDDMIITMAALESEDIHTDFIYEKNGKRGFWLEVTGTEHIETLSVAEIKQKMCDDYCRYTHGEKVDCIENICAVCPLNYLED